MKKTMSKRAVAQCLGLAAGGCLVLLASAPLQAQTVDQAVGQEAVKALGRLNGISLACKQGALAARSREIILQRVPKERAIGEIFEHATSEAFLLQTRGEATCPDTRALLEQIDAQDVLLQSAFAKAP